MKKILMSLLASTLLFAGGDVEPSYEAVVLPIETPNKYYLGGAGIANETYTGSGGRDYLGHSRDEFSNGGLAILGGINMSSNPKFNYALEGRLGHSFWMEDSENITTAYGGVYLRGNWRLGQVFQLYGAVGGAIVDFEGGFSSGESYGGASGIVGAEIVGRDGDLFFFVDYTTTQIDADINYLDKNVNFDTVSLGIRYEF